VPQLAWQFRGVSAVLQLF